MSAIGDYVHYTAYGYEVFGINRSDSGKHSNKSNTVSMFNKERNRIKSLISQNNMNILTEEQAHQLEQGIESLMVPVSESNEQWIEDAWNIIMEQLKMQFYEDVPNLVARSSADVGTKISALSTSGKKDAKNKTGHTVQTFLQKISQLNNFIDMLADGQEETKASLQKIMNDIYKNAAECLGLAANVANMHNAQARNYIDALAKNKKGYKNFRVPYGQAGSLIAGINQAANVAKGLSSYAKGIIFQQLIALVPYKGQQLSYEEIKKILQGMVTGSQKSSVRYISSNFNTSNLDAILGKRYSYQGNLDLTSSVYAGGKSSNKVDVEVNWNGKPLNISAKNLNLYNSFNINLVDEAPFLALLQTMDYDFVNHLLNLITIHYAIPTPDADFRPLTDTGLISGAKAVLKMSMLLSAFQGHKIGDKKANVFIVNNNKTGKVKVFNIGTLMQKALQHIGNAQSAVEVKLNGQDVETSFDNAMLNNNYATTVQDRLDSILAQLHGWKVSVIFNKDLII